MDDIQLAETFIQTLKNRISFDPLIQAPYILPRNDTLKITVDKNDIEEYFKSAEVKAIIKFINNRLVTDYEYEKINTLIEHYKLKNAEEIKKSRKKCKYEELVENNGK